MFRPFLDSRRFAMWLALMLVLGMFAPHSTYAQTYPLMVYTNKAYGGTLCYSTKPETANIAAACDNQISSMQLEAGWSVRVYRDANQAGPSVCFNRSDNDLSDNTFEDGSLLDNTISSFTLINQPWCGAAPTPTYPLEVYNGANYAESQCYSPKAETANIASTCNDQITSILLRSGWSVRVFREQNQQGTSACLNGSDADLSNNVFDDGSTLNNAVSSFILYSQSNCGASITLEIIVTDNSPNAARGGPAAGLFDAPPGSTVVNDHATWTYSNSFAQPENYITYKPPLPTCGNWEVFAYIPFVKNNQTDSAHVPFVVKYLGGETTVFIDEASFGNAAPANRWRLLGTYAFNAGAGNLGQYVRIGDNTGDGNPGAGGQRVVTMDDIRWNYRSDNPAVCSDKSATDTQLPTGHIVAPAENAAITAQPVTITAEAADNIGGKGVARVELYANFNGAWVGIGTATSAPYSFSWTPSAGLAAQQITFTIHVVDGAGNRTMDAGGLRHVNYTAPAAPASRILPVPYVDQIYAQNKVVPATCDDGNPGCYVFYLCGPSSVAMVLSYEGKEARDVYQNGQATRDLESRIMKDGLANWDNMKNVLWLAGVNTEPKPLTLANIKQSINNGHPVILGVPVAEKGHILVVVGYEGDNTIIVNDPNGGKQWWIDGYQGNVWQGNKWMPLPTAPQDKGKNVRYQYDDLPKGNALFITGPAPTSFSVQTAIDSRTRSLTAPQWQGQQVSADFPQAALATSSASAAPNDASGAFVVKYTAQVSPTQRITDTAIASFTLGALDASRKPVSQWSSPFTLTVNFDAALIDSLGIVSGSTVASEGITSTTTLTPTIAQGITNTTTITPTQVQWQLALQAWDTTKKAWVPVDSTFDKATGQLTAQTQQFAEYAVVVQYQSAEGDKQLFLPFIQR